MFHVKQFDFNSMFNTKYFINIIQIYKNVSRETFTFKKYVV